MAEELFISPMVARMAGIKLSAERPPAKKLELPSNPMTFKYYFMESKPKLTEFYLYIRREQGIYKHEEMHESVISASRYFPDNAETRALKQRLKNLVNGLIKTEALRAQALGKPIESLEITPYWLLMYIEQQFELYNEIPEARDLLTMLLRGLGGIMPKISKEKSFKTFRGELKTFVYTCLTSSFINNHLELHRRKYFCAGYKIILEHIFEHLPKQFEELFEDYFLRKALYCKKLQPYQECYSFSTFLDFLDDPIDSKVLEDVYQKTLNDEE